jgi:hypothetical protein
MGKRVMGRNQSGIVPGLFRRGQRFFYESGGAIVGLSDGRLYGSFRDYRSGSQKYLSTRFPDFMKKRESWFFFAAGEEGGKKIPCT